jgi:hypothetical protein
MRNSSDSPVSGPRSTDPGLTDTTTPIKPPILYRFTRDGRDMVQPAGFFVRYHSGTTPDTVTTMQLYRNVEHFQFEHFELVVFMSGMVHACAATLVDLHNDSYVEIYATRHNGSALYMLRRSPTGMLSLTESNNWDVTPCPALPE